MIFFQLPFSIVPTLSFAYGHVWCSDLKIYFKCVSHPTHCFSFPQDIFKQATEDRLTSAKELPYFEGDFWPNVLEESIKELEQEEEERKREENNTSNESTDVSQTSWIIVATNWEWSYSRWCHYSQATDGDSKNAKKKNNKKTSKNKSGLSRANKKKTGMPNVSNDLSQKLYATMEKHKEVFIHEATQTHLGSRGLHWALTTSRVYLRFDTGSSVKGVVTLI